MAKVGAPKTRNHPALMAGVWATVMNEIINHWHHQIDKLQGQQGGLIGAADVSKACRRIMDRGGIKFEGFGSENSSKTGRRVFNAETLRAIFNAANKNKDDEENYPLLFWRAKAIQSRLDELKLTFDYLEKRKPKPQRGRPPKMVKPKEVGEVATRQHFPTSTKRF